MTLAPHCVRCSAVNEGEEVTVTFLFSKEIRNKEPDVCRSFGKSSHKVRIPVRAKWNIHAHRVSIFCQLFLKVTADAIKHLKFQPFLWQSTLLSLMLCKLDALFIMGRDRRDGRKTTVCAQYGIVGKRGIDQYFRQ
jgi:hypothetical protein